MTERDEPTVRLMIAPATGSPTGRTGQLSAGLRLMLC